MSAKLKLTLKPDRIRPAAPSPNEEGVIPDAWVDRKNARWREVGRKAAAATITPGLERDLAAGFLGDVGVFLARHFGPPNGPA